MPQWWFLWLRGDCQVQSDSGGPVGPSCPAQVLLWGLCGAVGAAPCGTGLVPDGSGATPAQGTAEPLSNTSGASVGMCLREQKMLGKSRREEERQRKSRRNITKCMPSLCASVIEGDVLLLVARIELYI